ncbi:gliding motility protein GldB-related protein [Sediminitomix flava]|nr:DUF2268 domain-containing putative Zn-dependent protease [Sediminitomix flava]
MKTQLGYFDQINEIPDSVQVEGITIKNLFKNQILAHQSGYDSTLITDKVYLSHQAFWDNCYGMIFGEENSHKFQTTKGMIAWNRTLYPENKSMFDERAKVLIELKLDSLLKTNLKKFNDLVPYKVESTIGILFTPLIGIGFGGCNKDQFCIELNNTDYEIAYLIEKGLPHELNHLAYEPLRGDDPKFQTALGQVLDEGFACYFAWKFFEGEMTKYEAVSNMSESDWNWFVQNEKAIFEKLQEYFDDESGDNPILRNDKLKLFPDAPQGLAYWLGFRIVEKYVENHGENSWKDIYELNIEDVLDKSGYDEYISEL